MTNQEKVMMLLKIINTLQKDVIVKKKDQEIKIKQSLEISVVSLPQENNYNYYIVEPLLKKTYPQRKDLLTLSNMEVLEDAFVCNGFNI